MTKYLRCLLEALSIFALVGVVVPSDVLAARTSRGEAFEMSNVACHLIEENLKCFTKKVIAVEQSSYNSARWTVQNLN
jgi:hypothetical protein